MCQVLLLAYGMVGHGNIWHGMLPYRQELERSHQLVIQHRLKVMERDTPPLTRGSLNHFLQFFLAHLFSQVGGNVSQIIHRYESFVFRVKQGKDATDFVVRLVVVLRQELQEFLLRKTAIRLTLKDGGCQESLECRSFLFLGDLLKHGLEFQHGERARLLRIKEFKHAQQVLTFGAAQVLGCGCHGIVYFRKYGMI